MEDALGVKRALHGYELWDVLILVLMEDALGAIASKLPKSSLHGLNPCFNGRCTRSSHERPFLSPSNMVLILVLMEDALGGGRSSGTQPLSEVLILVLMEDALGVIIYCTCYWCNFMS